MGAQAWNRKRGGIWLPFLLDTGGRFAIAHHHAFRALRHLTLLGCFSLHYRLRIRPFADTTLLHIHHCAH